MSHRQRQFELAVRSFSSDLYRFAYWLARDRHVAEDLVQECFQRAWTNWETLHDEQAVKKWLFTILRREFLRRFERAALDTTDIDDCELPTPEGASPEDLFDLRAALAQAPAHLREPLVMQVLGGFSADELAALHDTTAGAMTTRLSRARQWFRHYLMGGDTRASTQGKVT